MAKNIYNILSFVVFLRKMPKCLAFLTIFLTSSLGKVGDTTPIVPATFVSAGHVLSHDPRVAVPAPQKLLPKSKSSQTEIVPLYFCFETGLQVDSNSGDGCAGFSEKAFDLCKA